MRLRAAAVLLMVIFAGCGDSRTTPAPEIQAGSASVARDDAGESLPVTETKDKETDQTLNARRHAASNFQPMSPETEALLEAGRGTSDMPARVAFWETNYDSVNPTNHYSVVKLQRRSDHSDQPAEDLTFDSIDYASPEKYLAIPASLGTPEAIAKQAKVLVATSDRKTVSNVVRLVIHGDETPVGFVRHSVRAGIKELQAVEAAARIDRRNHKLTVTGRELDSRLANDS